jgi:hypothetical protein
MLALAEPVRMLVGAGLANSHIPGPAALLVALEPLVAVVADLAGIALGRVSALALAGAPERGDTHHCQ